MSDPQLEYLNSKSRQDSYFNAEELDEAWEEVEESEWTQDGKYQHAELIVRHIETGRFFSITNSRSGSYNSDWYYSDPHICEVERKVEVVEVVKWVEKK